MPYDGVKSLGCGVFIDSLTKSLASTVKDANKVTCEGCDEEEAATMHCVDCGQNFGATCVLSHRKMKMSASHQLIPLHDALKGKVGVKRIPRCTKHPLQEINTYCKTCKEAVCPQCLSEKHSGHLFSPLEEMATELQDEVVRFTITMKEHKEEAKKAAKALDVTLRQIEKKRGGVESDMEKAFALLHSDIDLRHAHLLGEVDNVTKVAMKEKDEAEYAAAKFAGFCLFTEGLLTQGTPLEIAGSHKEVGYPSFFFPLLQRNQNLIFCFDPFQIHTRNEALEKLDFPAQPSIHQPPLFDPTDLIDLKRAITSFGSVTH